MLRYTENLNPTGNIPNPTPVDTNPSYAGNIQQTTSTISTFDVTSPSGWIESTYEQNKNTYYNFSNWGRAHFDTLIVRDIGKRWDDTPIGISTNGLSPYMKKLVDQPLGNTLTGINRRIADTVRIGEWMVSPPGVIWMSKQFGLHLMTPQLDVSPGMANRVRLFNPIKFFLNIPASGTGIHFERHGLIGEYSYTKVTTENKILAEQYGNLITPVYPNRLVQAVDSLYASYLNQIRFTLPATTTTLQDNAKKMVTGLEKTKGLAIRNFSGPRGPNSFFGIGHTTFFNVGQGGIPILKSFDLPLPPGVVRTSKDYFVYTENVRYVDIVKDQDSGFLKEQIKTQFTKDQPGASRFGGGRIIPNSELINVYHSFINDDYSVEEINDNSGAYEEIGKKKYIDRLTENATNKNHDSTKFPFATELYKTQSIIRNGESVMVPAVNPMYDGSLTPDQRNDAPDFILLRFTKGDTKIQFLSLITSLSTEFSPEWNPVKYIGRPDPVYIYSGVTRTLSLSFLVAIASRYERKKVWEKLNILAQFTAPTFNNNIMTAPLIRLQIGEFLNSGTNKGQPGFISALTYTIEDDYSWDLELKKPMYANISLSYTIIGTQSPGNDTDYFAVKTDYFKNTTP